MTPEQARLIASYLRRDADRVANSDERNLLREAAGIVESAAAKPQTQTQTPAAVRVRIAVMVDAEGHWAAYAWGTGEKLGMSSSETMATVSEMMTDYGGVERWVEADVPLPQPAQIIEGEVKP